MIAIRKRMKARFYMHIVSGLTKIRQSMAINPVKNFAGFNLDPASKLGMKAKFFQTNSVIPGGL